MLVVPHLLFGGALGEAVSGLPGANGLAFGLGIVSHLFLDSLPHWERLVGPKLAAPGGEGFNTETPIKQWPRIYIVSAVADVVIAALLMVYINWRLPHGHFYQNPVFWGGLGAVLPDLLDNVPFWNRAIANWPLVKQLRYLHSYFHISNESQHHMPKYLGLITQLVVFFFSAWVILSN